MLVIRAMEGSWRRRGVTSAGSRAGQSRLAIMSSATRAITHCCVMLEAVIAGRLLCRAGCRVSACSREGVVCGVGRPGLRARLGRIAGITSDLRRRSVAWLSEPRLGTAVRCCETSFWRRSVLGGCSAHRASLVSVRASGPRGSRRAIEGCRLVGGVAFGGRLGASCGVVVGGCDPGDVFGRDR